MSSTVEFARPAASAGADLAPELPSRIPSLDGLRAVSILLVVVAHLCARPPGAPPSVVLDRVEHLGNFGVKVFFEISGFLITTLLLRELSSRGRISLVGFYRRRILRIFPAYWAYLACLMVLSQAKLIELWPGDLLSAMTYTANYHHWRSWYVNHLWSLSVEEQFYLIWPLLLCLVGLRRSLYVAAAVVVAAPAVRTFMWFGLHAGGSWMTRQFEATADALAIGCVLAGCFNVLGNNSRYLIFLQSPWFVLVPLVGLPLSIAGGLTWFYVVGQSIAHLTIVLCVDRCVRFPRGALGGLLNSRPFVFLGVLSYSLYLWQMLFINKFHPWPINRFPINVVLAFAAAVASYYLIERPFLKLKTHGRAHVPPVAGEPLPEAGIAKLVGEVAG